MLTPLGVFGGVRGVFFANMGGGSFEGQPFKWWSRSPETYSPVIGFTQGFGSVAPIVGPRAKWTGSG